MKKRKIVALGTAHIYNDKVIENAYVVITGKKKVKKIRCSDYHLKLILEREIEKGGVELIPCFTPPPNTFLQAVAVIRKHFNIEDTIIVGLIEEKEIYGEEGYNPDAIY